MKQRLLIAFVTVLVFGAGFAARIWTEGEVAVPPAPTLGSEFVRPPANAAEKKAATRPGYDRAKLIAEIEELRPQIDAYRARVDAIDAEYDQGFANVLNAEQRKAYEAKQAEWQKKKADRESRAAAGPPPPPLTDEDIARLRQRPFESAFYKISFSGRLEQSTKDYSLDAKQQQAVGDLLRARRDKFLALIDSTPPPTIRLTALVTSVQRLADPAAQPAPAAK
jgi:hypothetical protein